MPLPADYFPRMPLPKPLVTAFEEAANAQLTADLARLRTDSSQNPAGTTSSRRPAFRTDEHGYSVLERHGVSVRTRTQPATAGTGHTVAFECHADVRGLPGELQDVMYADNTLALREWGKVFLSTSLVDAAMLHCVQRHVGGPGVPRTFAGVTWLALQTPPSTTRLSSTLKTDFCVFQTMGTRDDTQYITWTSVDAPNCASQEESLGLTRSNLGTTMFFQATAAGTRLTWFGTMESPSSLSKALVERVMGSVATRLSLLDIALQSYRVSKKPPVDRSDWVPDCDRRVCHVCRSAFTLFRSRHHCRACGDIMCKKCTVVRPSFTQLAAQWGCGCNDSNTAHSTIAGDKICLHCVEMPRPKCKRSMPTHETSVLLPTLGSVNGRDQARRSTGRSSFGAIQSTHPGGPPLPHFRSKAIAIPAKASSSRMSLDNHFNRTSSGSQHDSMLPSSVQQPFFGSTKSMSLPSTALYYLDPNEAQHQQSVAAQLWQISCRAQATLTLAKETTSHVASRTVTPLSTPRGDDASMRDSFAKVNQSLTEQAYLLEALDRASRGRFSATSSPVSNNATDSLRGRSSGWEDSVRFEVIPDDMDRVDKKPGAALFKHGLT
ncbi:hypothetical protein H310_14113 [Aphanomyces invadans]|uniref:FYVE-type domain-containing protein n=1 Tax=Aphanomyces invadans TaxID=157072 RepID=A0A024TB47_9STRA|nr:hypothetical protein H310_14113 [Aphanomyces invadans]ETV91268.1 hypothetical protein H310_14113 [Aphanomyces invadans]|eukprot:XP_008880105.1 hypothetical protein H310_14113 [Aphanomyces invadans]